MKAFLTACVAAVVLAVLAGVVLQSIQETSEQAFNVTGAKL